MPNQLFKTTFFCSLIFLTACKTMTEDKKPSQEDRFKKNPTLAANSNIALGFNYLRKHELDRSKEKFLRAIKDAPKLPAVWYSMAYFLETTGNIEEANKLYKKAIKIAPYDGQSHNNYGTFLCRHKRYDDAVKQFVYAAKQPSYLTVAAAYENAGLCSILGKKKLAAKDFFKQAIRNDPSRALSYFELAKLYFQEQNVEKSYEYFKEYAHRSKQPLSHYYLLMTQPLIKEKDKPTMHAQANKQQKLNNLLWTHKTHHKKKPSITKIANIKPLPHHELSQQKMQEVNHPSTILPRPGPKPRLLPAPHNAASQQAQQRYHIQLFVSSSQQRAADFARSIPPNLKNNTQIITSQKNHHTLYHVIVGNFSSKTSAQFALAKLPMTLRQGHPWVIRY